MFLTSGFVFSTSDKSLVAGEKGSKFFFFFFLGCPPTSLLSCAFLFGEFLVFLVTFDRLLSFPPQLSGVED